MKKTRILFLIAVILFLVAFSFGSCNTVAQTDGTTSYFRIHIRAHSNAPCDQQIKYEIRDVVTDFLADAVQGASSFQSAVDNVFPLLDTLETTAQSHLLASGFCYGATARIQTEFFPTRVYEDVTLACGTYTALIVTLGDGQGDNWWCVVYPPLCFTASPPSIVYKSKLFELWSAFFG